VVQTFFQVKLEEPGGPRVLVISQVPLSVSNAGPGVVSFFM